MEHHDGHFHWWHWLIIIAVIFIAMGVIFTWSNNYEIVKRDNKSVMKGIEETIQHPINTTENTVKDITE